MLHEETTFVSQNPTTRKRRVVRCIPAILAAGLIAALTISPTARAPTTLDLLCVVCGQRGLADFMLNIVLFLPLGLSLSLLGWKARSVLVACAAASAIIEIFQLALPGRTPSVRDVLANALGGWIAARALIGAPSWARTTQRSWAKLVVPPACVLFTIAATGWLLKVAPLGDKQLYGQWDPQFATMAHWGGELLSAAINGEPLPRGRMPQMPQTMQSRPFSETIVISAMLSVPPPALAPIVGIADARGDHLWLIGQDHDDLILRVRRRSALLRLNSPDVRFADALASAAPGDSITLEVYGIEGLSPCLVVNGQGTCSPKPAAGRAWALFLYRSHWPRLAVSALDALMLLLLALPVGFLGRAAPRRLAISGVACLVIGIPVAASLSGLAMPSFIEFVGLASGLTLGAFLALRASTARAPVSHARPQAPLRRSH